MDPVGDFFIAESYGNGIRAINHATGIITTIVELASWALAATVAWTQAELDEPTGLAVDSSGNVFIAHGNRGPRGELHPKLRHEHHHHGRGRGYAGSSGRWAGHRRQTRHAVIPRLRPCRRLLGRSFHRLWRQRL